MTGDSRPEIPATAVNGNTFQQISASMEVINLYCEHLLCHLEQLSTPQAASVIENIQTQLLLMNVLLEQLPQPAAGEQSPMARGVWGVSPHFPPSPHAPDETDVSE